MQPGTTLPPDGRTTIVRNDDLPPMTGERQGKSEMRVRWATGNPFAFSDAEIDRIRRRARQRVLDEHTSGRRAAELESLLSAAIRAGVPAAAIEEAV